MKIYRIYLSLDNRMENFFPYLINRQASERWDTRIHTFYAWTIDEKSFRKFIKLRDSKMFSVIDEPVESFQIKEFRCEYPLYEIHKYELEGCDKALYIPEIEYTLGTGHIASKRLLQEYEVRMENLSMPEKLKLPKEMKDAITMYRNTSVENEFGIWLKYYCPTMNLSKIHKYLKKGGV